MTWNKMEDFGSTSLIGELRSGFSRRILFAAFTVITIGIGLHLSWSIHQRSVLESRIRDAVAHTLQEPIRSHDLISIKRIVQAFSAANENSEICLMLTGNVVIGQPDCKDPVFQSYSVPLTQEAFSVSVVLPRFDNMVWTGLIFLLALAAILIFITKYLNRTSQSIRDDLENLFSNKTKSLKYTELEDARQKINEALRLQTERHNMEAQILVGEIASQVAHDIEAPLAALEGAISNVQEIPEQNQIKARRAMRDIKDISRKLLQHRKSLMEKTNREDAPATVEPASEEILSSNSITSLVDEIVSEKRLQFRDRKGIEIESKLDTTNYDLFASVHTTEIKRVMSNIINNGVEACESDGMIVVTPRMAINGVEISIQDNGKGIPKNLLPKILRGEKHLYNANGSGLGLSHARQTIERWGGSLDIRSEEGIGTNVLITLPQSDPPDWFVDRIEIHQNSEIIVLDDDPTIHEIWKNKFSSLNLGIANVSVRYFFNSTDFIRWGRLEELSTGIKNKRIHLFDYQLAQENVTGIDLLESHGHQSVNILVTGRADEEEIKVRCLKNGVKLLSKMVIGFAPIIVLPQNAELDLILIDDDIGNHGTWELGASTNNKKIRGFKNQKEFLEAAKDLKKEIPIYVDKNLSGGVSGLAVAEDLYRLGYNNLHITTGEKFCPDTMPPFLKSIIGKHFPEGECSVSPT